ncbi:MAG: Ig-like domain-containing protein [Desulfuromonadales bacterium]
MKRLIGAIWILMLLLAGCGDPDDPTRENDFVLLTAITIQSVNPQIAAGTSNQFFAIGNFSGEFTRDITDAATWQVAAGNEGVLQFTDTAGLANGKAAGLADITASLNGISGALTGFVVSDAIIQQLTVTPATASVAKGRRQQFNAQGLFGLPPDSFTQDLTGSVTWEATPSGVATINAAGLAQSVAVGDADINATFANTYGTKSGTAGFAVTPAVFDRVEVSPATVTLPPGETHPFTATAFMSDDTEQTSATFTWSSSDTGVATISATGVATAVAAGSTNITASTGGGSGAAALTVGTLQSIEISAASNTVQIGGELQLIATGKYSGNVSRVITSQVNWNRVPTNAATIDANGLFKGSLTGPVTVTATLNGISGTKEITVTQ